MNSSSYAALYCIRILVQICSSAIRNSKGKMKTNTTALYTQETCFFHPSSSVLMLSYYLHPNGMQHAQHELLFTAVTFSRFLQQVLESTINSGLLGFQGESNITFCRARSSSRTLIWDRKLASASSNVPAYHQHLSKRNGATCRVYKIQTGTVATLFAYCSLNNLSWVLMKCFALVSFSWRVLSDSLRARFSSCIANSRCLTSSGRSLPASVARRPLENSMITWELEKWTKWGLTQGPFLSAEVSLYARYLRFASSLSLKGDR